MDEDLAKKNRDELLDYMRACGGQVNWRKLPMWQFLELEKLEEEGIIERVHSTPTTPDIPLLGDIIYRLKAPTGLQ